MNEEELDGELEAVQCLFGEGTVSLSETDNLITIDFALRPHTGAPTWCFCTPMKHCTSFACTYRKSDLTHAFASPPWKPQILSLGRSQPTDPVLPSGFSNLVQAKTTRRCRRNRMKTSSWRAMSRSS